jgi:hypothetical protein
MFQFIAPVAALVLALMLIAGVSVLLILLASQCLSRTLEVLVGFGQLLSGGQLPFRSHCR